MQASDSTYVYVYFYPDIQFNETVFGIEFNLKPFYIGVGVKNRWRQHISDARYVQNTQIKHNVIRKIWNAGCEPVIKIIKDGLAREDALMLEGKLVAHFGKSIDGTGILANMVDGGRINPIMLGRLNPMYGKRIPEESIRRGVERTRAWRNDPKNAERVKQAANNISSALKLKSKEDKAAINQKRQNTLREKYPDRFAKSAQKAEDAKIAKMQRIEERLIRQKKIKEQLALRKTPEELIAWRKERYAGSGNPMYGNGHKLKGELNGRAKTYKIVIADLIFIVHGALKQFCKDFKRHFKTFDPLRSAGFVKLYNVSVAEISESQLPTNSLVYKNIAIFEGIPNDKFKKRKNCKD